MLPYLPLIVFVLILIALFVWALCRASARADALPKPDASAESYDHRPPTRL